MNGMEEILSSLSDEIVVEIIREGYKNGRFTNLNDEARERSGKDVIKKFLSLPDNKRREFEEELNLDIKCAMEALGIPLKGEQLELDENRLKNGIEKVLTYWEIPDTEADKIVEQIKSSLDVGKIFRKTKYRVFRFLTEYAEDRLQKEGWWWNAKFPLLHSLRGGKLSWTIRRGKLVEFLKKASQDIPRYEHHCENCNISWVSVLKLEECIKCKNKTVVKEKFGLITQVGVLFTICENSSEPHIDYDVQINYYPGARSSTNLIHYNCTKCGSTEYLVFTRHYMALIFSPIFLFEIIKNGFKRTILSTPKAETEVQDGILSEYNGKKSVGKNKVYTCLWEIKPQKNFLTVDNWRKMIMEEENE